MNFLVISGISIASLALLACGSDDDTPAAATDIGGSDQMETPSETPDEKETPQEEPSDTEKPEPKEDPVAETPDDPDADAPKSIIEIAVGNPDFSSLVDALKAADLVDALSGDGPLTVFAPTNDAFAAFEEANPGVLAGLSKAELTGILTYHVVGAKVLSTDLVSGSLAETLSGQFIGITLGDEVLINEAVVSTADVEASNGVIHIIDSIMLPPSGDIVDVAVAAGSFTQLAAALGTAELVDTLKGEGPFTVFAPTDAAFQAFEEANPGVLASLTKEQLTDILLYHVVAGRVGAAGLTDGMMIDTQLADATLTVDLTDGVVINESTVSAANVLSTNGVIHVIDKILLPPSAETPDDPDADAPKSIVEMASGNPDLSSLVDALKAADLVDALSGDGPLTVFAPTNDAFAAFEEANPGVLAGLSKAELTGILTYHVVGAKVLSTDLVSGSLAETLSGQFIGITLGDEVLINEAVVSTADVEASNGVIHIIDSIMLPPSGDIVDVAVAAGSFTQLAAALGTAELVDTLKGEGPFTVFAPTDAAFQAFEEANPGVLASLTKEQLTDILLYHVVAGRVGAAGLTDGMMIDTQLADATLTVDLSDGVVINDSTVSAANVLSTNGVIHVIDKILLPPSK